MCRHHWGAGAKVVSKRDESLPLYAYIIVAETDKQMKKRKNGVWYMPCRKWKVSDIV